MTVRHRAMWFGVAAGVVAFAAAGWQFSAGSEWVGVWLTILGLGLVGREPTRRYWRGVEEDDPAEPARKAAWMLAALAVAALGLGVTQLAGIGFREDRFRGFAGLVGAGACAYALVKAVREHRRISATPPSDTDPQ